MSIVYSVDEASKRFEEPIDRALAGEEVVIAYKDTFPIRVVPLSEEEARAVSNG